MSYTLDENGTALTETVEGVTLPIDFSFEKINDFVHSTETHFEELQALCLGMANEIERIKSKNNGGMEIRAAGVVQF